MNRTHPDPHPSPEQAEAAAIVAAMTPEEIERHAAAYEAAWTIDTNVDPYHETWRVQAPPMVRILAETQEWFMRQRLPPDPLAMMVCGLLYAPIFRRARVYTAAIEGVR